MHTFDDFSEEKQPPRVLEKHTRSWSIYYFPRRLGAYNSCTPRVWLQNVRRLPWLISTHICSDSSVCLWRVSQSLLCHLRSGRCTFYTASDLSSEAVLKFWNAENELLTNREHLEMAENLIPGGISSVFAKRYLEAKIKYLPTHDTSAKQTLGLFIDANNYGGITEKFPFKKNSENRKRNWPAWNSKYARRQVEFYYPQHLHDLHSFPIDTNQRGNYFVLARRITDEHAGTVGTKTFSTKKETDSITLWQNLLHIALSYFEIILWTGIRSHKNSESYNSTNQNGLNSTYNWTIQNGKPLQPIWEFPHADESLGIRKNDQR